MSADRRTVAVYEDVRGLVAALRQLMQSLAVESVARNGAFRVGLSGGSTVGYVSEAVSGVDTTGWKLFVCDERIVPYDDPDSNYGSYIRYRNPATGKCPWVEEQFVKIDATLSAKEAADDYAARIEEVLGAAGLPVFDALLLGVGPDGHTCSLFPGHDLLGVTDAWVAPITDSPKPPPSRITLTLPVINSARNCVFVAAGKGKAAIIEDIIKFDKDVPANLVRPAEGRVHWLLDSEAASKIQ